MAGSRSIGSIYAELAVRDMTSKGLSAAQRGLTSFTKSAVKWGSVATAAMTAAMVVGTKRVLDQVDSLGDLSTSTGVAVSDLMALRLAYKEGGLSADKAAADINKMQKAISDAASGQGGVALTSAFADMGLDIQKIIGMDPAEQFRVIGEAIMGIDNMAKRVAIARQIFGKSGGGLLAVFGNVEETRRSLGRMPELAERFADQMGRANDLIGRMPTKADQFFVGFASGIMDDILPGLETIDQFDFTELGQNLGESIGEVLGKITEDDMKQMMDTLMGFLDISIQIADKFAKIATFAADIGDALMPDKFKITLDPKTAEENWNALVAQANKEMPLVENQPAKPEPLMDWLRQREAEDKRIAGLLLDAKEGIPDLLLDPRRPQAGPDYLMDTRFADTDKKPAFESIRETEKDEFIKRGLMLGSSTVTPNTKIEEKQVTLLTEIRNGIVRPNKPTTEPVF